jgi:protein TonB
MSAFYKYVATTLRYPAQARRMGIEGKVFVQFVVDKDGTLTNVQAITLTASSSQPAPIPLIA